MTSRYHLQTYSAPKIALNEKKTKFSLSGDGAGIFSTFKNVHICIQIRAHRRWLKPSEISWVTPKIFFGVVRKNVLRNLLLNRIIELSNTFRFRITNTCTERIANCYESFREESFSQYLFEVHTSAAP